MKDCCQFDFDRVSKICEMDDPDTVLVTAWCSTHLRHCTGLASVERLVEFGYMVGEGREPLAMAEADE